MRSRSWRPRRDSISRPSSPGSTTGSTAGRRRRSRASSCPRRSRPRTRSRSRSRRSSARVTSSSRRSRRRPTRTSSCSLRRWRRRRRGTSNGSSSRSPPRRRRAAAGRGSSLRNPATTGRLEPRRVSGMAAVPQAKLRIGIDTGGTFTDIVAVDGRTGRMLVTKVASTPANPAVGLANGVRETLDHAGAASADVATLSHGTTVATNALLQGAIDSLGLIVTEGFRHILEIARQAVPDGYGNSYFWVKPERLVPLHLVREVGERLDYKGNVLTPLDGESARKAARFFKRAGVKAVGVCLIHSYANPAHERRVREILREEYPELVVSLSCEVLPEYREYERAVTTLVDAFVKPHMAVYLQRIKDELGADLGAKPFLVMQSSGGVISGDQVAERPITTALSGPAAGALGASVIARIAGF